MEDNQKNRFLPNSSKEALEIHSEATLTDLQHYIAALCKEKGWDKNSHLEIFLLLSEEVGELANAIRRHTNLHKRAEDGTTKEATRALLASELVDVLNYILDLANYFEIDLQKAFIEKNKDNERRNWQA
ncbi:MazG nucleotide pyrophosphohydrolase domain-containing protein [Hugenholtzia roseola]|uniref:MazG nucleotide pyrophosphohydrolase domain-containing protein n=1 Tax=Hugenholtzia roseola TaxID=1002 RepID=UPI0004051C2D|nr:MazG nucleotide pyrophosphohydrolase domain-containing protein [Hugenholtzia roseola]